MKNSLKDYFIFFLFFYIINFFMLYIFYKIGGMIWNYYMVKLLGFHFFSFNDFFYAGLWVVFVYLLIVVFKEYKLL